MSALDLVKLEDFLDDDKNEYGLSFAATHGFLVACSVGPKLDHWLGALFEDNESKVDPTIIEQLKLWQQHIIQTLNNEETIELPFEIELADPDSELGDWSIGFVDAMFLNEEAWFSDQTEEQVVELTLPMMVFSGIDDEDPQMESFRKNGDLLDEIAEEIPENLTAIYLMFHAEG